MKKQETPAQPKVVPVAVADFFPRPLKTAAPSKTNERGATLFPVFAWNRQNNRRATAAQLIRFHARLNLARLHNDNRGEATEKPELFERRLFRRRHAFTLTPRRSTRPTQSSFRSDSPLAYQPLVYNANARDAAVL